MLVALAVLVVVALVSTVVVLGLTGTSDDVDTGAPDGAATSGTSYTPTPTRTPSSSPTPTAPPHEDLGRSLRRLKKLGFTGLVARVSDGQGTWRAAFGDADREPRRKARADDRFRAGPVTQEMIAVLVLKRVAKGTWTLNTTIGDVLPDLWPKRSEVTVRQLLAHTSGIPDVLTAIVASIGDQRDFARTVRRRRSDETIVAAARVLPWTARPGTTSAFSNTGYVVLGMMLEQEAGVSVGTLLRDEIVVPAGLRHSSFPLQPGTSRRMLGEYVTRKKRVVDLDRFDPSVLSSAGALVTTTDDLDRFHRALEKGKLLRRNLVVKQRKITAGDAFGLGLQRLPDPCAGDAYLYGQSGGTFGTLTRAYVSADGRRRVTVAATGWNFDDPSKDGRALADFVENAFTRDC